MAGGRYPAQVLAELVAITQGKSKSPFLQKASIKQKIYCEFWTFILSNNRLIKHIIFGKPWFFISISRIKILAY